MFFQPRVTTFFIASLTGVLLSTAVYAAPAINTLKGGLFGGHGDVAILGYDPVAYFVDRKPKAGQDQYSYRWMGATWKFSTAEHLQLFKASPEKYAPQYGGYCAYGVAKDNLVSIEPDKWKVLNGKLYLNYDGDVQKKWLVDPAGFIKTADGKFSKLLKK
ncbi:MAG: YHS domain-containing (seleno)protein [Hafnia sp.]|uniref:YHS domain-containing (seleno)protein n=1 Tax=Hafnia sp. TaxID=1873498 RepID=UPI002FCBA64A